MSNLKTRLITSSLEEDLAVALVKALSKEISIHLNDWVQGLESTNDSFTFEVEQINAEALGVFSLKSRKVVLDFECRLQGDTLAFNMGIDTVVNKKRIKMPILTNFESTYSVKRKHLVLQANRG